MAPEQAQGLGSGPAVDIYALGAILYEMLTGRPPFQGVTTYGTLVQVMNQEPVPPGRLRPKLPRDLETICLKCLEKEPPRRYASAEALAEDLQAFLAGKPIRAHRAQSWELALRWVKRNPAKSALLGAAVVTALGLLLGIRSVQHPGRQRRGRPEPARGRLVVPRPLAAGPPRDDRAAGRARAVRRAAPDAGGDDAPVDGRHRPRLLAPPARRDRRPAGQRRAGHHLPDRPGARRGLVEGQAGQRHRGDPHAPGPGYRRDRRGHRGDDQSLRPLRRSSVPLGDRPSRRAAGRATCSPCR